MPIEVERKFAVRPDTEQRLASLGGQRLGSRSLLDRYFDTVDLRLTLADLWLRSREGRWQLKSPVGAGPQASGTTRYRETASEAEILALLRPVLSAIEGGLDRLAETGHLQEFATIRTQRISYRLPQGLLVDLDLADFGHQVWTVKRSFPARCTSSCRSSARFISRNSWMPESCSRTQGVGSIGMGRWEWAVFRELSISTGSSR
ncbi:thiamine-triphosphatase isoform X1 [Hemitrygon akajei]|uniref:thiamine-triphosphatase isoform X1 n=1 Tax=Hemitrygon akajei TaxID=2704970 RepID=UPI003BF9DC89